ncbi:MAG: SDR family NAD(P)-dependent oxidoreductase, partial [Chloroflexaceae bacterium]|nr:SDR family NAD(P)-dependent oxidoreductase [Chloroflexaceae bacterium]
MNDMQGKVVFVTGSARRVGRAIALAFAAQGASCIIHYSSASSADDASTAAEAVRAYGGDVLVVQGNQASSADVNAMFAAVQHHFGRLDVMVNSASIFMRGDLLNLAEAEWDTVLDTNLKGPFLLTQQAGRLMQANDGGVIINISDNSGLHPWANRPHHSVSKAGLIIVEP